MRRSVLVEVDDRLTFARGAPSPSSSSLSVKSTTSLAGRFRGREAEDTSDSSREDKGGVCAYGLGNCAWGRRYDALGSRTSTRSSSPSSSGVGFVGLVSSSDELSA